MAENSAIEWTHHTFNPWRGCTKVSPGCENCYAEKLSRRNPAVLGEWGPSGVRVVAAESYWKQPFKWDRDAAKAGERRRVFCASLADVFEDRPELVGPRMRLFSLIRQTPHLDWLLLTKRLNGPAFGYWLPSYFYDGAADYDGQPWPPPNVWLGVSVEDQRRGVERIPRLLTTPAAVHFLSVEPLLGPVDLTSLAVDEELCAECGHQPLVNALHIPTVRCPCCVEGAESLAWHRIDWVIVGGESGPGARPMHPDWARSLRAQCIAADTAFFFKQWGEWLPYSQVRPGQVNDAFHFSTERVKLDDDKMASRVGKKAAGRLLDGREWNEFPEAVS